MGKTKLFDSKPTVPQQAIVGFWMLNVSLVVVLWLTTTVFSGGLATILDAIGMLFGLLATFFALTQFMLMGRIAWIEGYFGLDRLAGYHRTNGYLTIICILIHPIFITVSYAIDSHRNILQQFIDLILHYNYVWLGFISEILFIFVVVSSIYIVRKRLKFETWYFVHLAVYAAIALVPLHQLAIGDSFAGGQHPLARAYWIGLYIFVGMSTLIWRLGLAVINLYRFRFRIDAVIAETPTTTSLYIHGRHLERWHVKPGQFVMLRIFAKGLWWQEHPFSISNIANNEHFRVTIRHVGDYTTMAATLRPGKLVLVSGPFGRFTGAIAQTNKRLFIAGGVGITPIRSLAEQSITEGLDSILLYANHSPDDVVFQQELAQLAKQGLQTTLLYSRPPESYIGEHGHIDTAHINRLVPDFRERDVYLCGPPLMMESVIDLLLKAGLNAQNLHYEQFSLHTS